MEFKKKYLKYKLKYLELTGGMPSRRKSERIAAKANTTKAKSKTELESFNDYLKQYSIKSEFDKWLKKTFNTNSIPIGVLYDVVVKDNVKEENEENKKKLKLIHNGFKEYANNAMIQINDIKLKPEFMNTIINEEECYHGNHKRWLAYGTHDPPGDVKKPCIYRPGQRSCREASEQEKNQKDRRGPSDKRRCYSSKCKRTLLRNGRTRCSVDKTITRSFATREIRNAAHAQYKKNYCPNDKFDPENGTPYHNLSPEIKNAYRNNGYHENACNNASWTNLDLINLQNLYNDCALHREQWATNHLEAPSYSFNPNSEDAKHLFEVKRARVYSQQCGNAAGIGALAAVAPGANIFNGVPDLNDFDINNALPLNADRGTGPSPLVPPVGEYDENVNIVDRYNNDIEEIKIKLMAYKLNTVDYKEWVFNNVNDDVILSDEGDGLRFANDEELKDLYVVDY